MLILVDKAIQFHAKNRKLLAWILFILLLLSLALPLYRAFSFEWDFGWTNPLSLVLAIVILPFNWMVEYQKHLSVLKSLGACGDKEVRRNSFAAGMLTGFVSPSYLGNFIGRMKGFPAHTAEKIARYTILSNVAQFVTTMIFGSFSLYVLDEILLPQTNISWVIYGLTAVLVFFGYVFLDRFQSRWSSPITLRLRLFLLSIIRYLIFSMQFALVIYAFAGENFWLIWQGVMVVYVLMTLSPSILSGKVLVREVWTVVVFSALGYASDMVLCAAFIVWFVNNAFPATMAWFYLKRINK